MDSKNALEYINSGDIREHLEKQKYQCTPVECAFLVWQSMRHTLEQKHTASDTAGVQADLKFLFKPI